MKELASPFGSSVTVEELHATALRARANAIAPYSEFAVGAAVETITGEVFSGCNIENATFGLTVCAERVALWKALSEGHRIFRRILVIADTEEPTPPCGACRQLLWEFASQAEIILADLNSERARYQCEELMPHAFDSRFLRLTQ